MEQPASLMRRLDDAGLGLGEGLGEGGGGEGGLGEGGRGLGGLLDGGGDGGGGGGGCKGHASPAAVAVGQVAADAAHDTPTARVGPMHCTGNAHAGQRKLA